MHYFVIELSIIVLATKMAEKALQKVEDELNCSICLDTYTNPKLLQCFHVYCQGCLKRLVFRDQQGQLILTCPNCRQVTPVPAGGVAGLQSAFHINRLLGIMEEHKKGIDESAHAENSSPVTCFEHEGKESKLYCETCGKLICLKCVTKHGKHHKHDHELMDEAFEKFKKEIGSSLKPVEKQLATINQAIEQIDTCCWKIFSQQSAVEADIQKSGDQPPEGKIQLIDQLHQIAQRKMRNLVAQKNRLETTKSQLESCLDFMIESMETDSHHDVLEMKKSLIKQINELTVPFQSDLLKPCTEADLNGESCMFNKV